jgi:hypothetical protein
MDRRTFVTGAVTAATLSITGCLGTEDALGIDDDHLSALRTEIDDRGVEYESVELNDNIVEVEHGYDEDPNDAIANVAMAFVERIADDWGVERLDGHLNDEGNDWTWYAEAEWAQAYADGNIEPDEYGERLSKTMTMVSETEE